MQIVLGKTRSNIGDVEMVNEVFQRRNTGKKYLVFPEFLMFSIKTRVFVQVFIAELPRARSARSGAPWVKKFGKLSIRENLVMT